MKKRSVLIVDNGLEMLIKTTITLLADLGTNTASGVRDEWGDIWTKIHKKNEMPNLPEKKRSKS